MKRTRRQEVKSLIEDADGSLLDVVDHLLNKGVVLSGDVVLAIADVELVYVKVSALLCAADRISEEDPR